MLTKRMKGIRMLMQQHIELFDPKDGNQAPKGYVRGFFVIFIVSHV